MRVRWHVCVYWRARGGRGQRARARCLLPKALLKRPYEPPACPPRPRQRRPGGAPGGVNQGGARRGGQGAEGVQRAQREGARARRWGAEGPAQPGSRLAGCVRSAAGGGVSKRRRRPCWPDTADLSLASPPPPRGRWASCTTSWRSRCTTTASCSRRTRRARRGGGRGQDGAGGGVGGAAPALRARRCRVRAGAASTPYPGAHRHSPPLAQVEIRAKEEEIASIRSEIARTNKARRARAACACAR